jgi:hypothetical protein
LSGVDIFLSYARIDRAAARMFAEAFADEGFSVWWDAALHSGETFDEVIERNLREAAAVVVLWSPRSVASRWVRAEATQADRRNKLAPAIIEPCDRPIIFELTHAADLCDWTGDITDLRWRTFVDDLRHLIEARAGQDGNAPAHAPEPAPPNRVAAHSRVSAPERKPLRPGNDEVIFAGGAERRSTPRPTPAKAGRPEDIDHHSDVHVLELADRELGEITLIVDSPSMKIGRLAPADLVVPHKSISREHCVIGIASDELLVTDLNSTNGTYIDGERITRATILPVGSVLQLGQVMLTHAIRPAAAAEADEPAARLAS